jgi:hypothetical protein
MAKVTVTPEVTKTVTQVVESKKFILELSENEALVIHALCGKVSGSDSDTNRKYSQDVYNVLSRNGIDSYDLNTWKSKTGLTVQGSRMQFEELL